MKRLPLAHLPTPLVPSPRLGELLGLELWVKRDDATGGAEAGNKIRKLELLLADAVDRGADTLITCGGLQSNHARATAITAASLGLRTVLYLRGPAGPLEGNLLLDRLVGAEVRLITADEYRDRDAIMQAAAEDLRAAGHRPYVIPEGGSNGLGALGYVEAMAEIRAQIDRPFDCIVHACGSGGTAAGVAIGAAHHRVASQVIAMAVCDDEPTFTERIGKIIAEARALEPTLPPPAPWRVDARAKGPAYAVTTPEQRTFIIEVARRSGLLLDPVYTGKAMDGLRQLAPSLAGARVLFLHTGGLPGLLAQASTFAALLENPC